MKETIAWAGIVVLLLAGVAVLITWAWISHSATCDRERQTVIAVFHNDPQDGPAVMKLYEQTCGNLG